VAIGLIWLQTRMTVLKDEEYQLTFFTNQYLLKAFSFIFTGANIVILGFAAKDRSSGKIARFWWPVTIAALAALSFIYWAGIRLTRVKVKWPGQHGDATPLELGDVIGFKVVVYNDDGTAPQEIRNDIAEKLHLQIDGSTRRVRVETKGWVKALGEGVNGFKDFLVRFLF
jgi:hypothetical protein